MRPRGRLGLALGMLACGVACADRSPAAERDAFREPIDAGGVNYRWPDRRREPLLVWVQPLAQEPLWVAAVKDAFADWEQPSLPLLFAFTGDSSSAEVQVRWVDRFEERMTGLTTLAHDTTGWINGATILLARQLPDGRANTGDGIRAIARHEIGHLLGLDHARDRTSIMAFPTVVTEIGEADRRRVRLVYSRPAGRVP